MTDQGINEKKEINKEIIDKTVWKLDNGKILTAYTAKWCGPCKRVKPHVLKFMNDNFFMSDDISTILKSDFKNGIGQLIPLFQIHSENGVHSENELIKEIQSSDFTVLEKIFNEFLLEKTKNEYDITEDF